MSTRRPSRRLASIALVLGLIAAATGCGYFIPVVVVLASDSGGGGGGGSPEPPPPSIQVTTGPLRSALVGADGVTPSATQIRLDFLLADAASADLSVELSFRRATDLPGSFQAASPAPGSPDLDDLASAPDPGIGHFFVWDAAQDLSSGEADVVLQLTPSRGATVGAAKELSIRAGNLAPALTFTGPSDTLTRDIPTTFGVSDESGDLVSLSLEGREVGTGGPFIPLPSILPGATRVEAPPSPGVGSGIVWSSTAAFGLRNLDVELLLRAEDLFGASATATATIRVKNDNAPVAQIRSVGFPRKPLRGRIPITYTVTDEEAGAAGDGPGGRADIEVSYSLDGGESFSPATGLSLGSGGVSFGEGTTDRPAGLFPDTVRGTSVFLWDSFADLGVTPESGTIVILRVLPVNSIEGVDARLSVLVENTAQYEASGFGISFAQGDFVEPVAVDVGVGDLDGPEGDGSPEIIVALRDAATAAGRLDTIRGFTPLVTSTALVEAPRALRVRDVDGDGAPDAVVLGAEAGGSVFVHRGDGAGALEAAPLTTSLGGTLTAFALGDLTGDGVVDLVAVGETSGAPALLVAPGNGDGTFDAGVLAPLPLAGTPTALALLDVSGDGVADAVVAEETSGGAGLVRAARVDGGALVELGTRPVAAHPTALLAGDFGDDPRVDLVAISLEGTIEVLPVAPGGGLGAVTATSSLGVGIVRAVAASELTGDGRLDIALALGQLQGPNETNFGHILEGQADLTFEDVSISVIQNRFNAIAILDIPGSPSSNILFLDPAFGVVFSTEGSADRRGVGNLVLDEIATPAVGADPSVLAIDADRDGYPDVVVIEGAADRARVLRVSAQDGRATGQLEATQTTLDVDAVAGPDHDDVGPAIAADLDGDGIEDLAFGTTTEGNTESGIIVVFPGLAAGGFGAPTVTAIAGSPRELLARDLDGDGIQDLIVASSSGITMLQGTAAGLSPGPPVFDGSEVLSGDLHFATGDFDGDGRPDLVVAAFIGADVGLRILRNHLDAPDPFGFDLLSQRLLPGDLLFDVVALDLTADGILDVGLLASDAFLLLRGRGDGRFDLAAPLVPAGRGSFAVFEADGDGVPDLLLSEPAGSLFYDIIQGARLDDGRRPGRGARGGLGRSFASPSVGRYIVGRSTNVVALDATPDGVPDVASGDPQSSSVHLQALTHRSASAPVSLGGAPLPGALARDVRAVLVLPLDPSQGEPGLVVTPSAGALLRPASPATTVTPDTATFTARASAPFLPTITLPLYAQLTAEELALSVGPIHVYRHERDRPGQAGLPFRQPVAGGGRIVEAASTAPPGGSLIAIASVDARAGTITFPVDRLGTFQAFLEAPTGEAVLLRETFDEVAAEGGALAPLPPGWSAGHTWQVGPPPSATASPPGPSGPASFPNVLGTNLRGAGYRAAPPGTTVADSVTSAAIIVNGEAAGRTITVRYREWLCLGAGDTATLQAVLPDGSSVDLPEAARTDLECMAPATPFTARVSIDLPPLSPQGGFRLVFTLTSDDAGTSRGWCIDDLEVLIR